MLNEARDGVVIMFAEHFPDAVVVCVEYRLAPEYKFPAAPNDSIACFDHFWENAEAYGVDKSRIVVTGMSAGGNLAAVVAQHARDTRKQLLLQVLFVPMILFGASTASFIHHDASAVLASRHMIWFWNMYCTFVEGTTDCRASPIMGQLQDLAPALLITSSNDPLRDEGLAYGKAMREAGVRVDEFVIRGSHVGGLVCDKKGMERVLIAMHRKMLGEAPAEMDATTPLPSFQLSEWIWAVFRWI